MTVLRRMVKPDIEYPQEQRENRLLYHQIFRELEKTQEELTELRRRVYELETNTAKRVGRAKTTKLSPSELEIYKIAKENGFSTAKQIKTKMDKSEGSINVLISRIRKKGYALPDGKPDIKID
jgi:DNA-binding CsgD family transcriptional regulator